MVTKFNKKNDYRWLIGDPPDLAGLESVPSAKWEKKEIHT
jgi:hypothetical protein